jgi:4-methylaminobutanoate oxidase (formaldehyde-forming)
VESLGNVYKVHFPHKARESARGAKRTPFYDRLAARGAYFRDVSGWECADWYGPPGGSGEARPEGGQRSWGRQPWFPLWAEVRACVWEQQPLSCVSCALPIPALSLLRPVCAQEHRACREGVVLMDMSFMSKFAVTGRDAGRCLNRLCTADVAGVPVGTITYCQFLNDSGKVEADVTVRGPINASQRTAPLPHLSTPSLASPPPSPHAVRR